MKDMKPMKKGVSLLLGPLSRIAFVLFLFLMAIGSWGCLRAAGPLESNAAGPELAIEPPAFLRVRWTTPLTLDQTRNAHLTGDTVLVEAAYGRLYALNATTGDIRWERAQVHPVRLAPCTLEDTIYYVANEQLFGVVAATGKQTLDMKLPFGAVTPPQPAGTVLVMAGANARLYGVSPLTAWTAWQRRYDDYIVGTAVYGRDYVAVLDSAGNLLGHSVKDGERTWSVTLKKPPMVGPGAAANHVYIGGADYRISSYDYRSGAKEWETFVNTAAIRSPVHAHGVVFVVLHGNEMVALNAADGAPLYRVKGVDRFVTATGQRAYAILKDGSMSCIGLRDGQEQGRLSLAGFDFIASAPERGQFFAVSSVGRVTAVADTDTLPKPEYLRPDEAEPAKKGK